MSCPFPGMDPYIERCGLWEDFHPDFLGQLKRAIAPKLPPAYAVRTGERYYIDVCRPRDLDPDPRLIAAQSDASVIQSSPTRTDAHDEAVLEAPVECDFAVEAEYRETYLDIREIRSGRIVTTIEMLSPSNKRNSDGRRQYITKRNACVLGLRNFIEIDLLRDGRRMPLGSDYPRGEYFITVFRQTRPNKCGVWPIGLRDSLPTIPVPLAEGDSDLRVDLSPFVNEIYVTSNYAASINYDLPLVPPLDPDGAEWVHGLPHP